MNEKNTRAPRRWGRFLLIYVLVFLALGALLLFLLGKFLESYEASRPKYAVDAFMETMTEEDWLTSALADPAMDVTEFEDPEVLIRDYFEAYCRGGEFTCRELAGVSTAKAPVFLIRSGSSGICRVYLEPDGSAGFGLTHWKVARITAGLSLQPVSLEISVPAGESVSVNGRELGSAYILNDHVSYSELTPLEHRFAKDIFMVLYRVDGLYGEITVTDCRGETLSPTPESEQSDVLRYEVGAAGEYSFKLTAPAGTVITINGAELGPAEEIGRDLGIFEGLERFVSGRSAETVTYTARGLHSAPEFIVTPPEGEELVSEQRGDGTIVYRYAPEEPTDEQLRVAKRFFDLYMRYASSDLTAYAELRSTILRASDFYSYIWDSAEAMRWGSDTTLRYRSLDFTDFCNYGPDCFTCRVSYSADITVKSWAETYSYVSENTYELLFARSDGLWLAAGMESLA